MAEALISPGVFLRENDQSQITQGPIAAGAALVGPTVIGPANIPTVITTYSQYKAIFGATFISGGLNYEYLTSLAAYNYFQQGGTSLLVTRVASGSYTSATASVLGGGTAVAGNAATASFNVSSFTANDTGSWKSFLVVDSNDTYYYLYATSFDAGNYYNPNTNTGYFTPNSGNDYTLSQWTASLISLWNSATDLTDVFTMSSVGSNLVVSGSGASNGVKIYTNLSYGQDTGSATLRATLGGGSAGVSDTCFVLETLSTGDIMNNVAGATGPTSILPSGSDSNIRWEISQVDSGSGLFTLLIRRGDDYQNSKTVLETWSNLSLDPNQNNYIAYVIGDQKRTLATDEYGNKYFEITGSYRNASNYVRIKEVSKPTPNYLDAQGRPFSYYTASLPSVGSGSYNGSFGGANGPLYGCLTSAGNATAPLNMFQAIPTTTANTDIKNIQGLRASDYQDAFNLLKNKDEYDYNSIFVPGLTMQNGSSQISTLLTNVQERGDAIAVVDTVGYNQQITTATGLAQSVDNSYGATYWPWVQLRSPETGKLVFVPASTIIPAVYEYNDKVSAEWFAPAGINRGGLPTVLQPERRLTVGQRNILYSAKVNPIATFPGIGTVVYGQKTLQARASALDRVNVRRLLIALKRYIGQIAETLVFEQNTAVTRNTFLSQVNPYLEYVQQKQGLYAFRVVMDDTNNTPDVIDRNILVGAIYLQPTKTAEFIQLDFNILPTGATFNQ